MDLGAGEGGPDLGQDLAGHRDGRVLPAEPLAVVEGALCLCVELHLVGSHPCRFVVVLGIGGQHEGGRGDGERARRTHG